MSAYKTRAINAGAAQQSLLIEAQFGPLPTFVTGGWDYPNHTALARKHQDYLRWLVPASPKRSQ